MHAIIVWGVLVSGAAIVVADESVTERVTDKSAVITRADKANKVDNNIDNTIDNNIDKATGISYRRWLQNAEWNENLSPNFGSFVVTRDEPLGVIGDIGEQWRQALLDTTDIREDLRAFVRAALVGQKYDLQASGESKLSYLSRRLPDIATDTLSAWGGQWAASSSAIEHVNVEWRTDLGNRPGHFALDVVGGLRETAEDVLAWQARGFVATGGDDNVDSGANVGLIWRKAALNNTALYGVNGFLDFEQAYGINFWRWSLGAEGHLGAFDFSANHYQPITDGEETDRYYVYSASGRDVQAYVRLADFFQQQLFVDVAAGITYYRWDGKERNGEDEGLRYGLRIGSYLNTPQALGQPLAMEFELDEESDVRWRVSYLHYFGAANSSFAAARNDGFRYDHTIPYNPREQFYAPVRREYTQRIRRQVLDSISYEVRSRGTDGLLRLGNTVNLYTGVSISLTVAVLTVVSERGDILTVSEIVQEYKLALSGNSVGASLLMNHLTLTEEGALVLTARIAELGSATVVVAEMTISGVSSNGIAAKGELRFLLRDTPPLVAPILLPPTDGGDGGDGSDGSERPEVGIDGNNYLARVPTPSDSVLLGGIGVGGSAPPYLITILNGHTSPRLLGISLTAASGRLFAYQPPHQVQIYGGHANMIWRHVDAQNMQDLPFTIAITAAGEQLERRVTIVPQPFEVSFSEAQLTLPGLEPGQSRTVSGISLMIDRYSGLPPYLYTSDEPMISFYSLTKNAAGLVHHHPGGLIVSTFMLTVTVTDTGGREASAMLSITIAVPTLDVSESSRNFAFYYLPNTTVIDEMGVYTLSVSGANGLFAQTGARHERIHFATIGATNDVYALSLVAGPTLNFTDMVTITYGDRFGARNNITVSILVALARYVAAASPVNLISRGQVARQIIASMSILIDDTGEGLVRRYEVFATDGSPLPASLNAQIVIVSNRLEWVSGGGNGAATITVAVRGENQEGRTTPLVPITFAVTDPPIPLALSTTQVLMSILTTSRAILTAEVRSETDDGGAHTITLLTEDGNALPSSVASLLSVNGTVLYVLGGTTRINATMQIVGLDADGRRSSGKLFELQILNSRIFGSNTFVRLAGLIRKALVTLTLIGPEPKSFEIFPSPLLGVSLSVISVNASVGVLTVISGYAADIVEQTVLVTIVGRSNEPMADNLRYVLTMRITPLGLVMAGGLMDVANAGSGTDEVWRFDTTDKYWERIGTLPLKLLEAAPLMHNGTMFLIGGHTRTPSDVDSPNVYQSVDGGGTWTENVSMRLRRGVSNARPIVIANSLYLIGGGISGRGDREDTDYVKAFDLSRLGSGATWTYITNTEVTVGSGGNDNYPLNGSGEAAVGYHNNVMFMLGGNKTGIQGTFNDKDRRFSFARLADIRKPSWLFTDHLTLSVVGVVDSPRDIIVNSPEVAVFQDSVIFVGGRTQQHRLYYLDLTKLSGISSQAQIGPDGAGFPGNAFYVPSLNGSTGGLANFFGNRKTPSAYTSIRNTNIGASEYYRNFSLGKGQQYLYLAGSNDNEVATGTMALRVCKVVSVCARVGDSVTTPVPWDDVVLTEGTAPPGRFGFMLLGPKNIGWNE